MADEEQIIQRTFLADLDQLGSPRWLEHHQALVQLSLRAVSQTAQLKEETVYSQFVSTDKITLLVYDAILIEIWREEVLPHLLKTQPPHLLSPVMVYSVLYHEGCIVTLLELILYHSAACEALGDSVVDLIDYCHRTLSRAIASPAKGDHYVNSPILKHLDIGQLEASIAIRCIGIMRYLAGNSDNSEIVTSRMLTTFDVPLLVIAIMELRPWIRSRPSAKCGWTTAGVAAAALEGAGDVQEIYDNGQWRIYSDDGDPSGAILHPVEAHLWLLLLSLVFHPVAPRKYDLTDHRCQQLLKLQSRINHIVVDQIPPLADFERWLVQLSVSGSVQELWRSSISDRKAKPFILELVAEVRQHLLEQLKANWDAVLDEQTRWLSDESPQTLQRLATIYDPEELEATLDQCATSVKTQTTTNRPSCVVCRQAAVHRCSRCRSRHYCSKECQTKDWPAHKSDCSKGGERPEQGLLNIVTQSHHHQ